MKNAAYPDSAASGVPTIGFSERLGFSRTCDESCSRRVVVLEREEGGGWEATDARMPTRFLAWCFSRIDRECYV